MQRSSIIERIKIKLDEFTPVDEGVSHPLDSYIQPTLDVAVWELLKNAPVVKLAPEDVDLYIKDDSGNITGSILTFEGDDIYRIDFPTNVIRAIKVQFPDWHKAVYTFAQPGSHSASMQFAKATRGGNHKPVVVLDRGVDGNFGVFVGFCYTHTQLETNEDNTFKREPIIKVITKKKPEELDDLLVEPLTLLTASKVFSAIQEHEKAKVLYEQYANNIMQ